MADMNVKVRLDADSGQLVGQLGAAEAAEKGLAGSADKVALAHARAEAALSAFAREQTIAQTATRAAKAAYDAGEISLEQYNRMLLASKTNLASFSREHTAAQKALAGMTKGAQAMTGASTQLGFQIQDITQGLAMGVNPMVVFGQQAGQTASAVAMMGGTAGRIGTFLAGPWGSLILAGVTILGLFVTRTNDATEALETAEFATYKFKDAQGILGQVLDLTTGKINTQSQALLALARAQLTAGQIEARREQAAARSEMVGIRKGRVELQGGFGGGIGLARVGDGTEGIVSAFQEGSLSMREAERGLDSLQRTGIITEEAYLRAATAITKFGVAAENLKVFDAAQKALDGDTAALGGFLRPKGGGSSRRSGGDGEAKRAREAQQLADFSERAAEQVQRVNERFGQQPKLLTEAAQASRQLDRVIAELAERKPPNWETTIASAREAQQVIEASLLRPFQEMQAQHERTVQLQQLVLAGRDDEAEALARINQLVDRVGFATQDQREAILANVQAERELNEQLQERQQLVDAYSDSIQSVRSDLEGLLSGSLSGGDFLSSLKSSFQQLQGRVLTEQLFGPALRELDEYVRQNTGISTGVDIMKEGTEAAGEAATDLADVLERAAARIDKVFAGEGQGSEFDRAFAPFATAASEPDPAAQTTADASAELVVVGRKLVRSAMALSPAEFFGRMARDLTSPMLDELDKLLGVEFFGKLKGALAGALEGYATAGPVGAVLGAAKEIKGLPDGLKKVFSDAFEGAQTGTQIAQIGKMLGLGGSSTGGAIGGAIGNAILPGIGGIVGGILGSAVGGLLRKSKYGTAVLTGGGEGDISVAGNSSTRREAASGLAGQVQAGLAEIAEQLGGEVGAFNTSIGVYKKNIKVSTSGRSGKLKNKYGDVQDFGDDEAAAVAFAIVDAIKDGAIGGLSAAVQRAVQSSADPEKALAEALKTRDLESKLDGFVGAARRAFQEFEAQAKERLRIATSYGLEVNKVEELNARERVALRKQLEQESFGSLQELLDRMRSGDLFEGSAVDQRQAILAEIESAQARAVAGEEGAADELARLLERLNAVSREAFATTGTFAQDRSNIEQVAQGVIDNLRAQLDAANPSVANPQIDTTNQLLDESNAQLAAILAAIRRTGGAELAPAQSAFTSADLASLAFTGNSSFRSGVLGPGDLNIL